MTEEEKEFLYITPYVKRPDRRKSEINFQEASAKELQAWQWWIEGLELFQGELHADSGEIAALDLPDHFKFHSDPPDPIKIIGYFCACHEWGVFPPEWIMDYFYQRFSEYLKDGLAGEGGRLGEYFGEPSRGSRRGQFGKFATDPVMEQALLDVDRFNIWFGINKKDAFPLVAQYLATVKNKTSHRFDKGPDAIKKAYLEWSKDGNTKMISEFWEERPPSRESKTAMLKRYPRDSFDTYLKRYPLLKEYLDK